MLASMEGSESPYRAVLAAVVRVVRDDHKVKVIPPREKRGDPPGWGAPLPAFGGEKRP
jgi:hypothetical protein